MDEKQLSIDIVGLAGAYSYALDCIEAEMVSETQWLHECGHCVFHNSDKWRILLYMLQKNNFMTFGVFPVFLNQGL